MSEPLATMVDVRDMLCAQALALIARAAKSLGPEEPLEVTFNAEDVRRDLLVWAAQRGYDVEPLNAATVRLRRRIR